ncbi:hypothetical protein G6F63_016875 [Rhizopus arrhizus]|nr:hypothetical protein G6F63_016875 [Rhizopus arrhizus]
MRQRSPASTACSSRTLPEASVTRTVPDAGTTNVLLCEPYSSAAWAIRPTLGTLPIVTGLKAPFFLQSSMTAW